MKNTKIEISNEMNDELKSEYSLDYSKSKLNRFAKVLKEQDRYIQLEPDIQKVFKNSEEVNNALRAFINAIPSHRKKTSQFV